MRSHLKDPVKGELLVNKVEDIAPVPCKVLDHSMGVELDPQVEEEQQDARGPSQQPQAPALVWLIEAGYGEEAVRHEVTHEDEIYDASEE